MLARFARCLLAVTLVALTGLAFPCLVGCTSATPLSPREPTPGAAHFTVMTYNIHRDRANDASTVAAVGGPDADVVCLQEVTRAWADALRGRYATQYPYMLFATKENAGGLAVLSRFPLEDKGVIPVPGDLHPGWLVVATTPGGPVQLVHVHLRSLFNGESNWVTNYFNTSRDHLAQLNLFMADVSPSTPMIVLGDFNEGPSGATVKHLEERGFRNALPLFRPGQFTWRSKSVGSVLDMTIDHIMFDPSFEPLSSWVEGRGRSDHLPVLAHLEWASPVKDDAAEDQRNQASASPP